MWAVAYFAWLPRGVWGAAVVPAWLLLAALVACIAGGGFVAGRYSGRGSAAGLYAGLLSGALDLMILGSLLAGNDPGQTLRHAAWWVPAWLAFCGGVSMLAASVGALRPYSRPVNWTGALAKVAVAGVLLLVLVGGMVTSKEAGLAVVDWPNSFGRFMFLLPLSRMTGGSYLEHSHRLIGSLVGLTTLVLAVHLWRTDPRHSVRRLIALALLAVIAQGVLGGLRVTGRLTLSTDPAQVAPKTSLAIVHGIFGQMVFGLLTVVAVVTSTAWHNSIAAKASNHRRTDSVLAALLVGLLLVQLALGALVRHLLTPPMQEFLVARHVLLVHVALAAAVVVWSVLSGGRAWGLYGERSTPLRRLGLGMVWLAGLQVLLGILSLVVTRALTGTRAWPAPTGVDVLVTTLHQTVGAVMLACAVGLTILGPPRTDSQPASIKTCADSQARPLHFRSTICETLPRLAEIWISRRDRPVVPDRWLRPDNPAAVAPQEPPPRVAEPSFGRCTNGAVRFGGPPLCASARLSSPRQLVLEYE